jgi:hypothetical protein
MSIQSSIHHKWRWSSQCSRWYEIYHSIMNKLAMVQDQSFTANVFLLAITEWSFDRVATSIGNDEYQYSIQVLDWLSSVPQACRVGKQGVFLDLWGNLYLCYLGHRKRVRNSGGIWDSQARSVYLVVILVTFSMRVGRTFTLDGKFKLNFYLINTLDIAIFWEPLFLECSGEEATRGPRAWQSADSRQSWDDCTKFYGKHKNI